MSVGQAQVRRERPLGASGWPRGGGGHRRRKMSFCRELLSLHHVFQIRRVGRVRPQELGEVGGFDAVFDGEGEDVDDFRGVVASMREPSIQSPMA